MQTVKEESYQAIFRKYYPRMFYYAKRIVGEDAADDVVQEAFLEFLKSATYRVSWEFTCKTTKILLLYIFLGHNRNVVNTKFPYPIKRLEVIRRFNQKSIAFNQSLS